MAFTLVLARYISQRTEQEDTSAQTNIGQTITVCPNNTPPQNQQGCNYIGNNAIQMALDALPNGTASTPNQLFIRAGTYTNVKVYVDRSQNVVISGEDRATTILNGTDQDFVFYIYEDSSNVTIQELTIKNSKASGINIAGQSQVTITNNTITQSGETGIILFESSKATITSNIISENAQLGIICSGDSECTITNNDISSNQAGGIGVSNNSKVTITNNTIVNNTRNGIDCLDDSECTIINNISYNNTGMGITAKAVKNIKTLTYNLAFGNGANFKDSYTQQQLSTWGNLQVNPQFENANTGDFRLKQASPARNAGDPNIKNPNGSRSDMGMYGGPGGSATTLFTNLSAQLEADKATFNFKYKETTPAHLYYVYVSDRRDVVEKDPPTGTRIESGSKSPIVVDPIPSTHKSMFTCGNTLYWVVRNMTDNEKSEIVEQVVDGDCLETDVTPPQGGTGEYLIQTVLSGDRKKIRERSCPITDATTGTTIGSCTHWLESNINTLNAGNIDFTAPNAVIKSINMYKYLKGNTETVRQVILARFGGTTDNVYSRDCAIIDTGAVKKLGCTPANPYTVQTLSAYLGNNVLDNGEAITRASSMSVTVNRINDLQILHRMVLLEMGDAWVGRRCQLNANTGESTNTCYAQQSTHTIIQDVNAEITAQAGGSALVALLSNDIYPFTYDNTPYIRQAFLDGDGKSVYVRSCPMFTSGDFIGSWNCADGSGNQRNWSKQQITGAELYISEHSDPSWGDWSKITGVDGFVSQAKSLGLIAIPDTATPVPSLNALTCTKTHSLANNAVIGSNVTYTIKLSGKAPGPNGTVIVRDDFDDNLELVEKPTWCVQETSTVQSAVLGISDVYSERGSVLISIVLFSTLAGGAVYLIVLHNRKTVGWKLIQDKPYLAGLLAAGVVLAVGSVYFLVTQDDVSPTDTPALTGKYWKCNVPEGTDTITYKMKLTETVGSKVKNIAEVQTGTNPSIQTCSTEFTVGSTNTLPPTNTPSVTPTVDPEVTPSVTPTEDPNTTPPMTETPVPTDDPVATATIAPVGFICGAADVDGDGKFTIYDFGGHDGEKPVGFARYYQKECDDTEEMRQTYMPCGGKDVSPDKDGKFGKIDIMDFQSFAQRYHTVHTPRTCDL